MVESTRSHEKIQNNAVYAKESKSQISGPLLPHFMEKLPQKKHLRASFGYIALSKAD